MQTLQPLKLELDICLVHEHPQEKCYYFCGTCMKILVLLVWYVYEVMGTFNIGEGVNVQPVFKTDNPLR